MTARSSLEVLFMVIGNNNNAQRKMHERFPKEVNSWGQLNLIQQEEVMLAFKEGYIKGFRTRHIPAFIRGKTGINISQKFVFTLRKKEYEEHREWFYHYARDSIAYVGAYHKAIDEIKQYKDELWSINLDRNANRMEKIAATKELHAITRTELLLLRDLPFITNLSKYYNPDLLDPRIHNDYGGKNNPDMTDEQRKEYERGQLMKRLEDSGLLFSKQMDNINTSIVQQILDKATNKDHLFYGMSPEEISTKREQDREVYLKEFAMSKQGQRDDTPISNAVMDSMREQLTTKYDPKRKMVNSMLRKESENKMYNDVVDKIDAELRSIDPDDVNYSKKVTNVKEKFVETMNYLDSVVTPEERETIAKLKKLTDDTK